MKALVTGGAGFIGSNIVKLLVRERHETTVLDNLSSGSLTNLAGIDDVRIVEGDIRSADALEKAIRGADTVFHLAASVGNKRSIEFPLEDASVNVIGTLHVL